MSQLPANVTLVPTGKRNHYGADLTAVLVDDEPIGIVMPNMRLAQSELEDGSGYLLVTVPSGWRWQLQGDTLIDSQSIWPTRELAVGRMMEIRGRIRTA